MKSLPETYVSMDIEADGPIPGVYSMLSVGAAAFKPGSRTPLFTFEGNLQPLPGAMTDPDTMTWWKKQPTAWAAATKDARPAAEVMVKLRAWLESLPGKVVFVGYPASYDFMFVYWYLVKFTGFPVPFGFAALDLKTMAMMLLKCPFRETAKRNMPAGWFEGAPEHTHKALEDAIGQGVMFINMLALRG